MELNQGHKDFQSIALPPELRYLVFVFAFAKVVFYFISTKDTNEKLSPLILLNSSAFAYNCPADCTPKQKMDSKLVRLNIGLNSAKKQKKLAAMQGLREVRCPQRTLFSEDSASSPRRRNSLRGSGLHHSKKNIETGRRSPYKTYKAYLSAEGSGPPGQRTSWAADLTSR